MLVEGALARVPSTPEPAAIRVTCLVLHHQHQSARPWFVYRGMIDRQSGQARHTRDKPVLLRTITHPVSRIAQPSTIEHRLVFFNRGIVFLAV